MIIVLVGIITVKIIATTTTVHVISPTKLFLMIFAGTCSKSLSGPRHWDTAVVRGHHQICEEVYSRIPHLLRHSACMVRLPPVLSRKRTTKGEPHCSACWYMMLLAPFLATFKLNTRRARAQVYELSKRSTHKSARLLVCCALLSLLATRNRCTQRKPSFT